jgi:ribosomal-protein-serine acetyltransferase
MTEYRTMMPIFNELTGPRVLLRPYTIEDAPALQAAVAESRDEIRPWLPFADKYQSVDEAYDYIVHCMAKWLLREDFMLGIWSRESGEFLGSSGFHIRDWTLPECEIGYWLRTSAHGKGYMTEAVQALSTYLLNELHAERVFIRCDALNNASAAVARRAGFIQEGRLRSTRRHDDGKMSDTLYFSLTASDPR